MNRIVLILILIAARACAQDAAAVLTRYVQVTGGADLYKRYNFVHLFYTVTHSENKTSENVDYFHAREGTTLFETDTGTATLDTGVSGSVAWKYSQVKGAQILSGAQAERLLAQSKGFDEDDWHVRYPSATLLANQNINGAPCRHVKLTRTDGSTLERFYDIKSGLLVREISNEFNEAGIEQPTTTDFQRYDTFFGIRRPVSLHVVSGMQQMNIEINTVTYSARPEAAFTELPHDVVRAIAASRTKTGLPNPVDLIDKFVAATGGKDRYQSIKTEIVKAEVSFVSENLKFSIISYSAGSRSYSSSDIPSMGKLETGDDGVTGWEKSVVMGPKLRRHSAGSGFMGIEAGQVTAWSQSSLEMETISQDQVNGSPCYLVRLGPPADDADTACFDVKTGLLVRTTVKDSGGSQEQLYSDYRAVNGFMTCYRIDTKVAGHSASVEIKEVAINQPLPGGIFDLPPDVKALKAKRDAAQNQSATSPGAPTLKRPTPQ